MIIEIDRDSMMQFPILTEEETGKLFRALGFNGGAIHAKEDFLTGNTIIWEDMIIPTPQGICWGAYTGDPANY